jgi:hypothetical protein
MAQEHSSDRAGSILSLHRYLCWASIQKRLREAGECVEQMISKERERAGVNLHQAPDDLRTFMDLSQMISSDFGLYFFYYFGALYVVVEGFRDLDLDDETVKDLLKSPYTQSLRRSRNGAFHFQREYLTRKLLDPYLNEDDFVEWAFALHDALRTCISREFADAGLHS